MIKLKIEYPLYDEEGCGDNVIATTTKEIAIDDQGLDIESFRLVLKQLANCFFNEDQVDDQMFNDNGISEVNDGECSWCGEVVRVKDLFCGQCGASLRDAGKTLTREAERR